MSDLSDIEQGFVQTIAGVLYPTGTSNPSAIGNSVRVFAGWPLTDSLDPDLSANPSIVNVSIYNLSGDRDVTRFFRTWDSTPFVPSTLTVSITGLAVTIGGTITAGHYATLVAGNQAASYAALVTDTPSTIAAALAAQFIAPVICAAVGPVVTFTAGCAKVVARTAAPQPVTQEVERLQKRFQITIWAAARSLCAAVAKLIRPVLMQNGSLTLADGSTVRIWPVYDMTDDNKQRANAYMRDMCYLVEYPTTIPANQFPVTTIETDIQLGHPLSTPIGNPAKFNF